MFGIWLFWRGRVGVVGFDQFTFFFLLFGRVDWKGDHADGSFEINLMALGCHSGRG